MVTAHANMTKNAVIKAKPWEMREKKHHQPMGKNKQTQSIMEISADKKGQSRSKTSKKKDDESVTGRTVCCGPHEWSKMID